MELNDWSAVIYEVNECGRIAKLPEFQPSAVEVIGYTGWAKFYPSGTKLAWNCCWGHSFQMNLAMWQV